MTDQIEITIKRCRIRSWRRGMKEMDLILGPFADALSPMIVQTQLELFVDLLEENDQDLYSWFFVKEEAPERYSPILAEIRSFHNI